MHLTLVSTAHQFFFLISDITRVNVFSEEYDSTKKDFEQWIWMCKRADFFGTKNSRVHSE